LVAVGKVRDYRKWNLQLDSLSYLHGQYM
jgi:hypothetical protein